MNTHVSPELANLLQDKKINIYSEYRYTDFNGIERLERDASDIFPYAPTIAEVVMWLYEKHQIWVHAMKSFKEFTPYIQCDWNYKQDAIKEVLKFMEKRFNSPTEAYEAAIEFTLNNLI